MSWNNLARANRSIFLVSMIGALVVSITAAGVRANTITGGISFSGNVTAYLNPLGTGPQATDYITAHSLDFGPSVVNSGANGTFAGIFAGTPVTMYSPLVINPPALPIPATSPLWQVTVGATNFSFTLATMLEPVDTADAMELTGSGIMNDGVPSDSNVGTWVATFTTSGSTFGWNASSAASVPEPGSGALMAAGGVALLRRRREK